MSAQREKAEVTEQKQTLKQRFFVKQGEVCVRLLEIILWAKEKDRDGN